MRLRRGMTAALGATLCCTGMALAGGGGDFGGFDTRSKTVGIGGGGASKVVRVTCQGDKRRVSAGFKLDTSFESGPVVDRSLNTEGGTKTRARSFGDPDDHHVTGYANCANRAPESFKRTNSTNVSPSESGSVKARCPQGSHAIAGGYKTTYHPGPDDFFGNLVSGSHPAGRRSWRVQASGVNGDRPDPVRLTAVAYCADTAGISVEGKTVPGNEPGNPSAVARCPQGTVAIAGGFRSSTRPVSGFRRAGRARGLGPFVLSLVARESRRAGPRRWKAVGLGDQLFGGVDRWKAFAVCAKT